MTLRSTLRLRCFSFLSASLLLIALLGATPLLAQSLGDTIRVQALDYNSLSRDTLVAFPETDLATYEKVLLKYSMRCTDGRVSTADNRNLGCGEWDYSCNTYIVDSSKFEEVPTIVSSHYVTNNAEDFFDYRTSRGYDYARTQVYNTQIATTNAEVSVTLGNGTEALANAIATDQVAGASVYLYTASELLAAGLVAGEIDALDLYVQDRSGRASYLSLSLKATTDDNLDGPMALDGFTQVYRATTDLQVNAANRFVFYTPYTWDGISNLLLKLHHSNLDAPSVGSRLAGTATSASTGWVHAADQEAYLTNQSYLEVPSYKGVGGAQNRTVEAWIKTSTGTNGEITSWGANAASRKWVFRFVNGRLRVENGNGGTESSRAINDGEWHHVAAVLDGDNLRDISFYVDGVLDPNMTVGTTDMNTDVGASGFPFRVSRGVNNRYLDAEIDEVRVWDTDLSPATLASWMRTPITASHPNYSNLQLYFSFDDPAAFLADASGNDRHAQAVGPVYELSQSDGYRLQKGFVRSTTRPNLTLYQGDYILTETVSTVDRTITQTPRHFLTEYTIVPAPANTLADDQISVSVPVEVYALTENTYDEKTGDLLDSEPFPFEEELDFEDLTYFRRFPFYNELVSFVTPYGIGLDFGLEGKSWCFDVSDYVHLLADNKRLVMTLGGQNQEEMDLEFLFITGTPPRDVLQFEQLWQGTNRQGQASIGQLANNQKFAPMLLNLTNGADRYVLKSTITGHGQEGEFGQVGGVVSHAIDINNSNVNTWQITEECSENPIYPQGGTWVYDRQGWCPGAPSYQEILDFTDDVSVGEQIAVDYRTSSPSNTNGDYRYHVAHQLVAYGPANFQQDASLVEIIAPNKGAAYTRVGTICGYPQVVLRNTGATTLTSATIQYWINDALAPQTYEWTGSLAFMEDATVTIPAPRELWFDIRGDQNTFYAEVKAPNGGTDDYPTNDRMASRFDFPEVLPEDLTVLVRTNSRPAENAYAIYDVAGNVVASNSLSEANNTYEDDYTLPAGCYRFELTDTGGDGLTWWANPGQGSGGAALRNSDRRNLVSFETDFGGRLSYSFSTDFALSSEELDFLKGISVFPNPVADRVTVLLEDLTDVDVTLLDASGRMAQVPVQAAGASTLNLDVSGLPAGLYFLQLRKGEVVTTRRLTKQ